MMLIAIYGRSGTGKTVISQKLAKHFKIMDIRHCGEMVKTYAAILGKSLDNLSISDHLKIDNQTAELCQFKKGMIIEGRYLNYVLSQIKEIFLIRLVCSPKERYFRVRKQKKLKNYSAFEFVERQERRLVRKLYSGGKPSQPSLVINTSRLNVDGAVEVIRKKLKRL